MIAFRQTVPIQKKYNSRSCHAKETYPRDLQSARRCLALDDFKTSDENPKGLDMHGFAD